MIFSRAAPSETELRFEDALLIRPAMNDGLNGAPDTLGARMEVELSKAGDATQVINVA